ncbi:hypothetical protein [Aphanothece sacrum]|uniref:Uncharacterized protein n=1 Tax=Aphanothece sacrum FPU1 TaxID=1920663 RepID=A0A401IH96_APHSA|nr:hypothetical protein [Aphanothece sacrum]GBF80662.1 hypothetical protein AsFPU1_2066 [Aphanothece sacrum FPU1]GBF83156.1 hypothetical protein AsFPU3_0195 [Aphanothece sacrum FPU3]
MSSPERGPYQSRLFNFINRQSWRWRDRIIQTAQHLKLAAQWGTQVLIYPIYLLVQAGRSTRQKLDQTIQKNALPPETAPKEGIESFVTVDRPLKRVLEAIDPWFADSDTPKPQLSPQKPNYPAKITHHNSPEWAIFLKQVRDNIRRSLSQPNEVLTPLSGDSLPISSVDIQGMATLLDNRHIVLVTLNNQTLDILSPQQQKQLLSRIRLETANYWYEWRLIQAKTPKKPGLISQFSVKPDHVLPPVRWFWQIMRWVQTGEVAITLNFFGESSLVSFSNPNNNSLTQFNQIDDNLALWDNSQTQIKIIQWEELNTLIQKAIDYFFGSSPDKTLSKNCQKVIPTFDSFNIPQLPPSVREKIIQISQKPPIQALVEPVQKWGEKLEKKANYSLDPENNDPFTIQVLIYAAIDYFFGQNTSKSQLEENTSPTQIKGKPDQPYRSLSQSTSQPSLDDPWLSWDDFALETPPTSDNLPNPSPDAFLPQGIELAPIPEKYLKKPSLRRQNPKTLRKGQSTPKAVAKVKNTNLPSSSLTKSDSSYNLEDVSSDWIETKAKSTGYVKHPLVYILEWLDRLIHWLEEWGVKFYKFVRKKLKI